MFSENTKMLEFNQYEKSKKTTSIIYVVLESLLKNYVRKNNPEKSSSPTIGEDIPSSFSMFKIYPFKDKKQSCCKQR